MRTVKFIKYAELVEVARTSPLSIDDDRAVAEFRAFYHIGALHAERVTDSLARNSILEVLETLTKLLQKDVEVK